MIIYNLSLSHNVYGFKTLGRLPPFSLTSGSGAASEKGYTPLRKHAYSNILKNLPPKNENFQIKKNDILHISTQNIRCGYSLEPPRRGSSNVYSQSMFLNRNKKKMYTAVNHSFTI